MQYGPNINNPRDPRFGRLSELPSEDPYHAGHYAVCVGMGPTVHTVHTVHTATPLWSELWLCRHVTA